MSAPFAPKHDAAVERAAAVKYVAERLKALGPEHARTIKARRDKGRIRKQRSRAQRSPEQQQHEKEQRRERKKLKLYLALDGEGGGEDDCERQRYLMMAATGIDGQDKFVLHNDGAPLKTVDALEFILSLPKNRILVCFGLGYDATQILRGLPSRVLQQIIDGRKDKNGNLCYTFWKEYAIQYQQGQFLRINRIDRSGPKPKPLKGSCRTVWEVRGFFQCTFLKAITDWNIGTEDERAIVEKNKKLRNKFSELTPEIIEYCKLECRLLGTMMEAFREACHAAGYYPRQWAGAGRLADAILTQYRAAKRPPSKREQERQTERDAAKPPKNPRDPYPHRSERDDECEKMVNAAYYGGRFEVARIGYIPGPLFEYDVRSAYPAAMLHMPCPLHTRWVHSRKRRLPSNGELYVARITFTHPPDTPLCGFPFRKNGGLYWPLCGTGTYWSPLIEAAQRFLHADIVSVHDVWIAKGCCDCRPYDWIRKVYARRMELGPSTKGFPIKLGLNAIYGKRAQRSGSGPFHDPVEAGLITAMTQARIIEAVAQDPEAIVMIATDAVISRRRLSLDFGKGLGQWEEKVWPDLFIAQPGIYFSPTKLRNSNGTDNTLSEFMTDIKSRGVKRSVIGDSAHLFLQTFKDWFEVMQDPGKRDCILRDRHIPTVPVTVRVFYGCRIALHRNKPWLAGKWEDVTRRESFDWDTKRDPMRVVVNDEGSFTTFPRTGHLYAESEGYAPADFDKAITIVNEHNELEEIDEDMLFEGMPDHVEFLPQ